MDIQQLTRYENVLMGRVRGSDIPEPSDPLLKDLKWEDILRGYLTLIRDTGDLEAVKRAIFLIWFTVADPECVTGIDRLESETIHEVFRLANDMAGKGRFDRELSWMLPFYYSVADFYLAPEYGALKAISLENKSLWMTASLESSFDNRGQLGAYWKSIQDNIRTREE